MADYPKRYRLLLSKMVAPGEPPIPVTGEVRFSDSDTAHFVVEVQDRSWGPSDRDRSLVLRRQADGPFRGEWTRVLAIGIAARNLPPVAPPLGIDLEIAEEDGGDFAGSWDEDGKPLEWTGQLHLNDELPKRGRF
jgi:hypothetical protein